VKTLFGNSLSDTQNVPPCRSKETSEDQLLPESYDWRLQFPHCVQEAVSQGNCSASYALATVSMVADRICQQSNRTVKLSTQEVLSCDKGSYGCEGGYVTRTLNWGKRKGFIPEACYPYTANKTECDVDEHL
jgi:cathepsin B